VADDRPVDAGPVQFRLTKAPTRQYIAAIGGRFCHCPMRWLAGSGLLDTDDVLGMLGWGNEGLSVDASMPITGPHRAGLESSTSQLRYL